MQYRLGIDLGGMSFKIGLVDENYNIVAHTSRPTRQHEHGFEAVVADIADAAEQLAKEHGLRVHELAGIGLGAPGCVDHETGDLLFAGNLKWFGVPLRKELEKCLGVSVHVGNDADCAIIGETLAGAARGKENVLMLTLGTGVGGGLIVNGHLYAGTKGTGGELGHVPFVFNGEPCTCGLNGCLEAYASVTAFLRYTREAMDAHPESLMHAYVAAHEGVVSGLTAFACAKQGDAAAIEVIDNYTTYVAAGIGGFINVFRPEIVLIGGGISAQGPVLIDPIVEKLPRFTFATENLPLPRVAAASLGNDAGIIGAACMDLMD